MPNRARLAEVAESRRTPLVEQIEHLLEENRRQAERIQQARGEGVVLKGHVAP